MRKIQLKQNDAGQRADRFLTKHFPKAPKNFLMRMLRKKNITRNQARLLPEDILQDGDVLEMFFSDETYEKFRPTKGRYAGCKPHVMYEDRHLMICDKEPGLLSHVASDLRERNLLDGLLAYLVDKGEYDPRSEQSFVPALCHRLDRNTAGLVLFGKTAKGLQTANTWIRERKLQKKYYAIVEGKADFSGELRGKSIAVGDTPAGKEMISSVRTLMVHRQYSFVEIVLRTGRTHQIRQQMASLGHPILGDTRYGGHKPPSRSVFQKQHLAAVELAFPVVDDPDFSPISGRIFRSSYAGLLEQIFRDLP